MFLLSGLLLLEECLSESERVYTSQSMAMRENGLEWQIYNMSGNRPDLKDIMESPDLKPSKTNDSEQIYYYH